MRTTIATLLLLTAGLGHAQEMNISHQKHVLKNGLQVLLHEDHSDPVVALFITYHVGSAREEIGRSGFAHLFEHMLFQGSQNVGDDKHFKLISEAGGTLNGTTNQDRTLYYEVLPSNQLELALWLESDRMGFLLPAVTQEKLDNQRDVVKNERRQNYENRPYGQARGTIAAAMYPADHPYSWITIGSQEDLTAATLDDVHGFFRRWYGPNNATLAIGGDIDPEEALRLAEKYFGAIPRGPEVARPEPRQAHLEQSKRLALEDRVKLPRLMLTWHTTPAHGEDDAALQMLSSILSANKSSILDKALTVDEVLASSVFAANMTSELSGLFQISVTAAPGVSLDDLELRVGALLAGLGREGVDAEQLRRMKTRHEARFLRGFETVSGKTRALAEYNMYLDDPDYAAKELQAILAVTPEDVERVLGRYILGQRSVVLSIVPEGKIELAASGRTSDQLATETGFDRTVQPVPTGALSFRSPTVWHDTLPSGIRVVGSPYSEIPMTQLALSFPGGHLQETMSTLGVASLLADLLEEGTERLSTIELTEAFDTLGASLSIRADDDEITLTLSCLDKHLDEAVALLTEIVLEPRFDPADFERLKKQRLISIESRAQNIGAVAGAVFQRLMFGDSVRGMPSRGTKETVEALSLETVRSFFERSANPAESRLVVVGNADAERVHELFGALDERWKPARAEAIHSNARLATGPRSPGLYLVDKPGATQSQIRIGHMSVASVNPDYYALTVMNYPLGGTFSSRINMNLREDKGYTYGARSSFRGGLQPNTFAASAGVHTQYTSESVTEFLTELNGFREGLTEVELDFARNSLVQAASRRYESMGSLLGLLDNVSLYGWSDNYPEERIEELRSMDKARLDGLAREHIRPDSFVILVVGDREEIQEGLEALDLGPITVLDIDGAPVEDDS